ncbi:RidA family protein [Falsiroseomonas sp.]|uniref:RidA family protein n=1 Tax=Falsiroseomonas sp. TaxID=2870721 RepID=UPI0027336169|nr:RidA family protein [Falsiroseomonas sp.]MDP3418132.1 RidA family protein [Falsiroseomonas sp.]
MNFNVTHLEGTDFQQSRAFSPAVITQGGRTVWLSGQTATQDLEGRDISWDFEAQVRTCYALMDRTLVRAGGSLASLVWTTVYILDPRHGDLLVKLRAEHFPGGAYPCSALLTVSAFARPGILVEIQGIGVVA